MPVRNPSLAGIACIVAGVSAFAAMDVLIKLIGTDYSTFQVLFFRMLFSWLPFWFLLRRDGGVRALRTRRPWLHAVRSVLLVFTTFCFFFSFQRLPLAEIYAISFASPLLMTLLSVPMLGERFGWRRGAAIAVGFLGVLVILRPGGDALSALALVPLVATATFSVGMLLGRMLARTDTNSAILFYLNLLGLAVAAAALPFVGRWPDDPRDWALFVGIGLLGGVAQIFQLQAFRLAPAAVIGPFQYLSLLWGLLWGWTLFAEWPDAWSLAGAAVVMASGLYVLYRETAVARAARVRPAAVHGETP